LNDGERDSIGFGLVGTDDTSTSASILIKELGILTNPDKRTLKSVSFHKYLVALVRYAKSDNNDVISPEAAPVDLDEEGLLPHSVLAVDDTATPTMEVATNTTHLI